MRANLGISRLECISSHRHDDQALSVLLEVAPSQALDCVEQLIQLKCDHVAGPDSDPIGAMGGCWRCAVGSGPCLDSFPRSPSQHSLQSKQVGTFNPNHSTIRQPHHRIANTRKQAGTPKLESLCNEETGMQNTERRGLCPPAEQIPKSIAPVISKASDTNPLQLPGRSASPVSVGREESGLLIGPA